MYKSFCEPSWGSSQQPIAIHAHLSLWNYFQRIVSYMHSFVMGNFWSYSDDDANETENDDCILEASPVIKILVIYEQPQGTGLHLYVTLDPRKATSSVRSDLANVTNVPAEHIRLIYKNSPLEDDISLHGQGVQPNSTIVLRDSRLKYSFL